MMLNTICVSVDVLAVFVQAHDTGSFALVVIAAVGRVGGIGVEIVELVHIPGFILTIKVLASDLYVDSGELSENGQCAGDVGGTVNGRRLE